MAAVGVVVFLAVVNKAVMHRYHLNLLVYTPGVAMEALVHHQL